MFGRVLQGVRRNKGRNPRGYGLPSLVVVLFFVAVVVQAIMGAMLRETTEAKAEAAFNITKEHLDTFKATNTAPLSGDAPHISGSNKLVRATYTGPVTNPQVSFTFLDHDARSRALYEQKLRAYANIPNTVPIGAIGPNDIRREFPERVLRSGDRMATPLTTQEVSNVGRITTGTNASTDVTTNNLRGLSTTHITSPRFGANRLQAGTVGATNDIESQNITLSASLSTSNITSTGLEVSGYTSATSGTWDSIVQTGQFASADRLAGIGRLSFEELTVAGLRVRRLNTDRLTSDSTQGRPTSGTITSGRSDAGGSAARSVIRGDRDDDSWGERSVSTYSSIFGDLFGQQSTNTSYDNCRENGSNAYTCLGR